jgi:PucR family transcriptional regulator, purine catabolism regulatory protein
VHVTEFIDPSRYLRGGELVLTNGLWRRRRKDSLSFVEAIQQGGAIAMGYGLRTSDDRVPADVSESCSQFALTLLSVPHDIAFSSISEAVSASQAASAQEKLLKELRRNQALLSTLGLGSGAAGILQVLHREHSLALVLINRAGRVIARCGDPVSPAAIDLVRASLGEGDAQGGVERLEINGLTVFPIAIGKHADAYLLCGASLADLSEEQRSAIDQASAFLGLELARVSGLQAAEARFGAELVDAVLEDRLGEARSRLHAFDVDPHAPLGAVVFARAGNPQAGLLERVSASVSAELVARRVPGVAVKRVNEVVTIVSAQHLPDLRPLADQLLRAFTLEQRVTGFVAGVGSVVPRVDSLRWSLKEAEFAARVALESHTAMRVVSYLEVNSYRLLMELQAPELLAAFRDRVLRPLVDYDERTGSNLVETLRVFLSCTGQWQGAAQRLHIHVNTLRYRIQRIEELTGRDLASMDARIDFHVALQSQATG